MKCTLIRSRLVGKEINTGVRPDLFAATPPLEMLKVLMSYCAQNQDGSNPIRLATIDIKRAYFYAQARREVYVKIPEEDFEPGDEGRVAKLRLSLYGTRDAAQNWAKEYGGFLVSMGFQKGAASPCNFHHDKKSINLTCHGDDFFVAAPLESIHWLIKEMSKRYELKSQVLGPEEGCHKEVRILNRIVRWTSTSIEYEPDQRHAEMVVKELGLEGAKPLSTPGVQGPTGAPKGGDTEAERRFEQADKDTAGGNPVQSSKYRAIAARLNYLAQDRPDIQFAVKCIAKHMSAPDPNAWQMLKRVGRYLVGCPRVVQRFEWAHPCAEVEGYGDSDWAGDKSNGKSTSGGAVMWANHVIKTWSSTQQTTALSSGEAELYAMTKAASQVLGIISMLRDFGMVTQGMIKSDATAAIGMVHREGLGRTRHIRVQYLWMQEKVAEKELQVSKVGTLNNVADLMTKHLSKEDRDRLMKLMSFERRSGMADTGLRVSALGGGGGQPPAGDWWICTQRRKGGSGQDASPRNTVQRQDAGPCGMNSTKRDASPSMSVLTRTQEVDTTTATRILGEVVESGGWVRRHVTPRQVLFTPMKVSHGPTQSHQVGRFRISCMKNRKGVHCRLEEWKHCVDPHSAVDRYTGWTAFVDNIPADLAALARIELRPRGGNRNHDTTCVQVST